ncbi:MAG: hypothetical protein WCT01_01910 [Candidatus Shapirobacteria bacterium]
MSSKINLLPNAAKFKAYRQLMRTLNKKLVEWEIGVGVVALVLIIGVGAGVRIWSGKVEKTLNQWKQEFANLGPGVEASQKIKYQAKIVGRVMDERFEYGQAFGAIGKLFPPEVILEKSDFKNEGSFNVAGIVPTDIGVDQVESIIRDINEGKNEYFTKMELKKMSWNPEGWQFEATVYLKT